MKIVSSKVEHLQNIQNYFRVGIAICVILGAVFTYYANVYGDRISKAKDQLKDIKKEEVKSAQPIINNITVGRDYIAGDKKETRTTKVYTSEKLFTANDEKKIIDDINQVNLDSGTNYRNFSILFAIASNGQNFARGMQKFLLSKGYIYNGGGQEDQPFDGYKLIAENNEIRIIIGSF